MLPKKQRLQRDEFPNLFKKGKTVNSAHLSFRFVTDPKLTKSKFSIVISKKTAKTAVVRNRFRRRGYEAIAKISPVLNTPLRGAFFAKTGAEKMSFPEIKREINNILEKIQPHRSV